MLIIAGGIVLVLALAGFIIYRAVARGADAAGAPRAGATADYVFSDESGTQWFSQGDGISVTAGNKTYRIVIANVDSTLTLKVPGGTVDIGLGKERYIDLDGDSNPDLRIVWNDVDRSSSVKRVNLGLYRTTGDQRRCRGGR